MLGSFGLYFIRAGLYAVLKEDTVFPVCGIHKEARTVTRLRACPVAQFTTVRYSSYCSIRRVVSQAAFQSFGIAFWDPPLDHSPTRCSTSTPSTQIEVTPYNLSDRLVPDLSAQSRALHNANTVCNATASHCSKPQLESGTVGHTWDRGAHCRVMTPSRSRAQLYPLGKEYTRFSIWKQLPFTQSRRLVRPVIRSRDRRRNVFTSDR